MEEIINTSTQENNEDGIYSLIPKEYIERLTPAKLRFINLYLSGMYTKKQMGQLLGVNAVTLRHWELQPDVQAVIEFIQNREFALIDNRLKQMRHKALDVMDDLMDNAAMETVRFSAAKDILDRTGHKAQQQIKVEKTVQNVEEHLKTLSEFDFDKSNVVDVDDILEIVKNG